eukprot:5873747-Karenia_brevis.AAC.1
MNAVPGWRPFLGSFSAWTASLPGGACVRLPAMLPLILIVLVDAAGVTNLTLDCRALAVHK